MNKYTKEEIEILNESKYLKEYFEKGMQVNTHSSDLRQLGTLHQKYYKITFNAGCGSCLVDMFRNLYNKLNEETATKEPSEVKSKPVAKVKQTRKRKPKTNGK